eukprot:gnl/MRDRNA2_/MRDRNA2_110619_c0_seq1.p1 gnl/MRDRNA2_/MRDRNA2_110619_c0~~gnl/MRDRNA2_/MRDRNA2_110619_c0_seq1.p1  ORF type:complete len:286 (-),score=72.43 gnl/MRDRNA2_/MRDRNA2_110619_c0_seq1:8-865(-)
MVQGGIGFDFDALDEIEAANSCAEAQQVPPCSTPMQVSASSSTDHPAKCAAQNSGLAAQKAKPMSRARAWFEIRKLMEAVPQDYYKSQDTDEWKIYWAKELILKKVLEKIKTEGYAVVDAQLAPDFHEKLAGTLALEAPDAFQVIGDDPSSMINRLESIEEVDADPATCTNELACNVNTDTVSTYSLRPEGYNSCRVVLGARSAPRSIALSHAAATALQPRDKETFLTVFKTFLHVVASNSVSKRDASDHEKIPVQLVFGTPPPGKQKLTGPTQAAQIQDVHVVD